MSDEDILWLWSQLSVLNQPSQAPPVQPFAEGAWGPPVNSGPLGNSPIDIPHETSMFSTYGPRNNPQETFPRSYDYTSQLPSDCYQTAYNGCPAPPTATRTADVSPFSRSYHPLSFTDRSFDERFASGNEQQVAYVNPQVCLRVGCYRRLIVCSSPNRHTGTMPCRARRPLLPHRGHHLLQMI